MWPYRGVTRRRRSKDFVALPLHLMASGTRWLREGLRSRRLSTTRSWVAYLQDKETHRAMTSFLASSPQPVARRPVVKWWYQSRLKVISPGHRSSSMLSVPPGNSSSLWLQKLVLDALDARYWSTGTAPTQVFFVTSCYCTLKCTPGIDIFVEWRHSSSGCRKSDRTARYSILYWYPILSQVPARRTTYFISRP